LIRRRVPRAVALHVLSDGHRMGPRKAATSVVENVPHSDRRTLAPKDVSLATGNNLDPTLAAAFVEETHPTATLSGVGVSWRGVGR